MGDSCIFCRIIEGSLPSHRLYEDDDTIAFLDINPVSPWHTLVIPKRHASAYDELDDETAAAVGRAARRVARAINDAASGSAFNLLLNSGVAAGQEVFHVHMHIIPRVPGDGHRFKWTTGRLPPKEKIAEFVESVKAKLGQSTCASGGSS